MKQPAGNRIAARALDAVDTPFRLYGRAAGVALDCAGLVLYAADCPEPEQRYSLRGDYQLLLKAIAREAGFRVARSQLHDGDIALVQCDARQQHLLVRAQGGWVHAHAGLGRVVHTPDPSPWPIIARWRFKGI
jgi:murein DD-endopeptidase / murein LD-carboxypeptidase